MPITSSTAGIKVGDILFDPRPGHEYALVVARYTSGTIYTKNHNGRPHTFSRHSLRNSLETERIQRGEDFPEIGHIYYMIFTDRLNDPVKVKHTGQGIDDQHRFIIERTNAAKYVSPEQLNSPGGVYIFWG
jgi:hypothetical protein